MIFQQLTVTAAFTEGTAVVIDNNLTVVILKSATVKITNWKAGDELQFIDTG